MKVLIVDDHRLFASGLKNLMEAGGITVVGTVCDGTAAVAAVREHRPDMVLMDIQLPGCDGLQATRLIKTEFPSVKVVILTMNADDQLLLEAKKNGAAGFLLKNLEAEEFLALLSRVATGEVILPELNERRMPNCVLTKGESAKESLTARQKEVLTYIARGMTYRQVAELLYISETTIKYHMNEILVRLHLQNRAQAIAYAVQSGLTNPDE
ncbi:luxr bacterial regulatory protein hth signature [Lucifera butyrica]|uniref:Luxr bacterial regulatory protein hth signature n=1 Tax=Lucifera butyrica TaxID=1351585 RepID=A0A498RF92_9FIRM|nr:response regulator transcription factor [Lucifera butyrica]VBB09480.1 luxr bacterial regulatory protein hth signature [Lucifera butyrica]